MSVKIIFPKQQNKYPPHPVTLKATEISSKRRMYSMEKLLAVLLLFLLGGTLGYIFYTNIIIPLRKPPSQ
jgi:hypothetical protein